MVNRKISFLMAAHNEEKIIGKTLENFLNIPYSNYEVLIGLDGCSDNTEKIVKTYEKKSKKFRHFNLNLRSGKPAVIDNIIKKAKGEIIIIVDADWIFRVKDKKSFEKFLKVFDNPKIGGVAESFPVEWDLKKLKRGDLGYRMVAYSSYYWMDFQKKYLTISKKGQTCLKEPTMFMTNIFRKKLYNAEGSLGDDIERTKSIMDQGYEVILFRDIGMPRMLASYSKIPVRDLLKQKIRTAMARRQLEETGKSSANTNNYYIPLISHILKQSWKKSIYTGMIVSYWIFIAFLATLIAKFKKLDTKKGWQMRLNRS